MSKQLHSAMRSILKMPYFKNDAARSGSTDNGHEESIAARLVAAGFTRMSKNQVPALTKEVAGEWIASGFEPMTFLLERTGRELKRNPERTKRFKSMPKGSFICQPGGSHSFPDTIIRDFDGRFIAIEAKSSENATSPMWNDSLPRAGAIYIWSTLKSNRTTFAMGQDLIDDEITMLRKEINEKVAKLREEYSSMVELADRKKRGYKLSFRPQNFQEGGGNISDWIAHPDCKQCEINVLEFAK